MRGEETASEEVITRQGEREELPGVRAEEGVGKEEWVWAAAANDVGAAGGGRLGLSGGGRCRHGSADGNKGR